MKTSGLFTTHGFQIPFRYGVPIRLLFFGDVHWDSPNHAKREWQEFLQYADELDHKTTYFFGMGDYLDSTSTTERECLGTISKKMHETFRNDVQQLQLAKCEALAKELAFMRGRIIGLLNGNHYFEFASGLNSDQKLCELLGTRYLGVCSLVRLSFNEHSKHGHSVTRDLFAHHGKGAARLLGGSLNRVAQMAEGVEADIYAMGHDHKRLASPGQTRLFLRSHHASLSLEQRDCVVLRCGSFLSSYKPGQVDYNVDECRAPNNAGHVEVLVTIRNKGDKRIVEMRTMV